MKFTNRNYTYFPVNIADFSYLIYDTRDDLYCDMMAYADNQREVSVPVIRITTDSDTGAVVSSRIVTEYPTCEIRACVKAQYCCGHRAHLHYIQKTKTLVHRCEICKTDYIEPLYAGVDE